MNSSDDVEQKDRDRSDRSLGCRFRYHSFLKHMQTLAKKRETREKIDILYIKKAKKLIEYKKVFSKKSLFLNTPHQHVGSCHYILLLFLKGIL